MKICHFRRKHSKMTKYLFRTVVGVYMLSQLKLLFFSLILMLSFNVFAESELKTVEDLGVFKQQVVDSDLPVLLMFTAEDCDYCDAIRVNYLLPMIKSGDYASTLLFRQIYIEDFNYIKNENGELISGDIIPMKYDVDVTPTILFINSDWQELTERIIGVGISAFFDEQLNTHITQAVLAHARAKQAKSKTN
jgi:thiol-disulfide isomerase/thioredoxin